jgi:hypothetical protein
VPSPALRELQEAFWRSLATGVPDPVLADAVASGRSLAAADRVGIYTGMYFHRLLDVLREDYPHVAARLGDDAFAEVVRRHLAAQPSTRPSVRHVGGGLAELVPDQLTRDLARLEWARVEIFDAPDAEPLGLDELRRVPPDDWPALRLALVPAAVKVVVDWPVHRLWRDGAPEPAERTALRVWRQDFRVYQSPMDRVEEAAFDRLAAGDTFAAICEVVGDAAGAAGLLLRWIGDGLLVRRDPAAGGRS